MKNREREKRGCRDIIEGRSLVTSNICVGNRIHVSGLQWREEGGSYSNRVEAASQGRGQKDGVKKTGRGTRSTRCQRNFATTT